MMLEEYFGQDEYFSESAQDFISVRSMPFQHACYAYWKLKDEHGNDFIGSRLYFSFYHYLHPGMVEMREKLRKNGRVAYAFGKRGPDHVRGRLHRAAAKEGLRIKCESTRRDATRGWVEAVVDVPVNVTAHSTTV